MGCTVVYVEKPVLCTCFQYAMALGPQAYNYLVRINMLCVREGHCFCMSYHTGVHTLYSTACERPGKMLRFNTLWQWKGYLSIGLFCSTTQVLHRLPLCSSTYRRGNCRHGKVRDSQGLRFFHQTFLASECLHLTLSCFRLQ